MVFQTLIVAFIISYIGSIPPGTINVSVMQLSILKKHRAAIFFALAASSTEFIYAGVTVRFHIFLSTQPVISDYFKIVTSITLIALGLWNILSTRTSSSVGVNTKLTGRHGFLRGLLLGIFNPMTIPFWLAITTYLENDGLINVSAFGFWAYLTGLSTGTFCLLLTVDALGKRFIKISDNKFLVHKMPGIMLIGLGVYFLLKLILP
ncbi:MAG: LysE family transporter [Ekhidna sp.]|nr:LysE family transporter [Ekhidna sp.]MBC6410002.1 LysE family transporter [Ekhidna sp.]MBC6426934.1 LysE family transporter [Ekhidna sp.]